jgi:hypothetical protein
MYWIPRRGLKLPGVIYFSDLKLYKLLDIFNNSCNALAATNTGGYDTVFFV